MYISVSESNPSHGLMYKKLPSYFVLMHTNHNTDKIEKTPDGFTYDIPETTNWRVDHDMCTNCKNVSTRDAFKIALYFSFVKKRKMHAAHSTLWQNVLSKMKSWWCLTFTSFMLRGQDRRRLHLIFLDRCLLRLAIKILETFMFIFEIRSVRKFVYYSLRE